MQLPRRGITSALAVLALASLAACWRVRSTVEETLSNAVSVYTIADDTLVFPEREPFAIPGGPFSQRATIAVWEATRSGVEIDSAGRAIGLIRIHHWCGTDPIGRHLARVPIVALAQFIDAQGLFAWSEHGWDVSQYYAFERSAP